MVVDDRRTAYTDECPRCARGTGSTGMASGKRRIQLDRARKTSWLQRLFGCEAAPAIRSPHDPPGVDTSLRRRAAVRAVRTFIESIDTYQLHTRRTVHVVSSYRVPPDSGLRERVPEWIAERVRFGIVKPGGEYGYLTIKSVDVSWNDDGTELYLYLDERVAPGTRAFIAAYLGEAEGVVPPDAMPSPRLLGEPG